MSSTLSHFRLTALVLSLCCLSALGARSAAAPDESGGDAPSISAPTIQQRLKEIDESSELEESLKATLHDLYQQALKEVEAAAKSARRAAESSLTARSAPEEIGRLRRELGKLPSEPQLQQLDRASLD